MEDYKEIDKIVLLDTTKLCLHSALRHYYFYLRGGVPNLDALSFEERHDYDLVFQECKRLLQEVFGDSVVRPDNTHDLSFQMKVCECENPSVVFNPYTKKKVFKVCGKCSSCRRKQQSVWIARMQQETRCHSYVFNLYLTYDDVHVPIFDYVDHQLVERQKRFYDIPNFRYPLVYPANELKFDTYADLSYFVRRGSTLGFPHVSVYDLQTFKKRLNTYIAREVTGKYGNYRSVICHEYGPTTHRIHHHGAIWFDDPRLAQTAFDEHKRPILRRNQKGETYTSTVLNELVIKAWRDTNNSSLGYCECTPDRGQGKSVSYTAKYIKLPSDIPSFFKQPPFFAQSLTSRNPPIGSLLQSTSEILWIFDNAACSRVVFSVKEGLTKVSAVPIGKSYKDKLFPKCPLYGEISAPERLELYKSVISNNGVFDSFYDYFFHVYNRCCTGVFVGDRYQDLFNLHLENGNLDFRDSDFCKNIRRMTSDFTCLNSLLSLYRIGCRIWYQCSIFDVSYDAYLKKIFEFYDKYEQYKLRMFYLSQDEYFSKYDINDLPYWYPLTYFDLGYDPSRSQQCLEHCKDVKIKNEKESKTLKKNIYFESLKVASDPSKRYLFNLIKSYYNGKKCNETLEAFSDSWKE